MSGTQVVAGLVCLMAVTGAARVTRAGPSARRLRLAAARPVAGPVPARTVSPPARASRTTVPMLLDLIASALAGGAAPPGAVAVVADCLDRSGDPAASALRAFAVRLRSGQTAAEADDGHPAVAAVAAALELAMAVGVGPVGLIRATAEDRRRRAHEKEVHEAHRLAVLVLLPTGLCLLPAFVLLTVVPLVIDLVIG